MKPRNCTLIYDQQFFGISVIARWDIPKGTELTITYEKKNLSSNDTFFKYGFILPDSTEYDCINIGIYIDPKDLAYKSKVDSI